MQTTRSDSRPSTDQQTRGVTDQSLVLRNHDGSETCRIHVQFLDHEDRVAFERTFTVAPLETVTVGTRLERAVYRVDVRLESGGTASAECLIGSGLSETAVVQTGNGVVSVVEGVA